MSVLARKLGLIPVLMFMLVVGLRIDPPIIPNEELATSSSTVYSVSKSRLAFVSTLDSNCGEDEPCNTAIDVINSDGSDRHNLIAGQFDPLYLTPCPDGRCLIYVSPHNGAQSMFVVNIAERHITQLPNDGNTEIETPSWSPDGKYIVFSAEPVRTGNTTLRSGLAEIYTVKADGSNQSRLTYNRASDFDPIWSPDSQHIAFLSDRDGVDAIYLMNVDGSRQYRLTKDDVGNQLIAWSPDSHLLLFTRYIGGKSTIYTYDVENEKQSELTGSTDDNYLPSWSPNSREIAFTSNRTGHSEIYLMNAEGDDQHLLTMSQANDLQPTWSPDGKSIAFTSLRDGTEELYVIELDGSNPKRLTYGGAGQYLWLR